MYQEGLAPSTIYVVPTITPGAKLSTGRIDTSILILKRQADDGGASMFMTPFDGSPETAWGVVRELLNGMKLGGSFAGGCVSEEIPFRWWGTTDVALEKNIALSRTLEEDGRDLDEIITLQRAAFQLTSPGHQEHLVTLTNFADCLEKRFWKEGDMEDLMEAIPIRRAALELTPPGHQEYRTFSCPSCELPRTAV
ncbi:hypothetical protein F5J12DRAFT_891511 [Pisolithus orientalis]|uniref:uncharacterized protein n=1 Tax=Pisolithus orientalis TaxID=936130 RepID=UPI002224F121|nr:uncharacterized protein F5J12DRAFT_891511 [Pisolithus orientalis]KAI6009411.1 hypothetical protein F5J12DRAFT_891511 [Pisolithus orientalis]